jgi:4,5-dihydroxyphthalate decarboxylase
VVDKNPWVVKSLMDAFDKAKAIAMKRVDNPRVNPLAFWAHAWFEQKRLMGPDPWAYGLTEPNRRTLDKAIAYTKMQGLISRTWTCDELFSV